MKKFVNQTYVNTREILGVPGAKINYLIFLLLLLCSSLLATTNYVWQGSPTPTPPYTSWATAAHTIQDAVDSSLPGNTVLVTNGYYNSGEIITPGYTLSNRVVITKNITLKSVAGPSATIILGKQAAEGGNGTGAVRCVFMTAGTLSGFTISNGNTLIKGDYFNEQSGGGVWITNGCVITNCVISGNAADYDGGGVFCLSGGVVADCSFSGNNSHIGGGIFCFYGGVVYNCSFTDNSAEYGGGVQCSYDGLVNNCVFSSNSAGIGGGARCYKGGEVNNCTIKNNIAEAGGGIYNYKGGVANNCAISMNNALGGGGVYLYEGGGLNNCTISDNDAFGGGGVICDAGGSLTNTIIFFNTALVFNNWLNDDVGMSYAYCCTTPDPGGTGNITNNPVLVNFAHIATNSPCVGNGDSSAVAGVDIDGDSWLNPPAIGCDQPTLAGLTGTLSVVVYADMTNLTIGAQSRITGNVNGMADMISWSFGEGTMETNLSYVTDYAWDTPGVYSVILTAFNSDNPGGVAGTVVVYVVAESIHYVVPANPSSSSPYLTWSTAATNIQDAIDACYSGGKVLVTNGIYATGVRATPKLSMPNRVVLTKNILVESVNGPDATFVLGSSDPTTGDNGTNAVRCLYMSSGSISGFTFSNGHTRTYGEYDYERSGGGVLFNLYGAISNCVVSGNSAQMLAGGVYCLYGGMVNDCKIIGNNSYDGGGVYCYYGGAVINSIVTGNNGNRLYGMGGGVMCEYGGIVDNCTIKNNGAGKYAGGIYCNYGGKVNNCKIFANYATNIYTSALGGGLMLNTDAAAFNCEVSGNFANKGGGTLLVNAAINNCTISGNSAGIQGGGVWCSAGAFLTNCIVYYNTAPLHDNWYVLVTTNYTYCCTTPLPFGVGNITNAPMFENAGAANYHLLEGSPCIDAGTNMAWMTGATDLDGNPRIYDGKVDMGCYEFVPEPCYLLFIIYQLLIFVYIARSQI